MDVRPDQDDNNDHQCEKRDKPAKLEDIAARHLATANRSDLLRFLARGLATFMGTLFHRLAVLACALGLSRRLHLCSFSTRRGLHLRIVQADASVVHFRIAFCIALHASHLVVTTSLVELFFERREHAAGSLELAANCAPDSL